jgi:uracil-DNA glycosylase
MTTRTKDVADTCARCGAFKARVGVLCGGCWRNEFRLGRRKRTLIVGLNPGSGQPINGPALVGSRSGKFLAALCGVDDDRKLTARFELVNLFTRRPGSALSGRERAAMIKLQLVFGRCTRVLLLGEQVIQAWDGEVDKFQEVPRVLRVRGESWDYRLSAIPHPSGLCRAWNDMTACEHGKSLCTRIWEASA